MQSLSLPVPLSPTRIHLYAKNVDMRKSFDGLHAIIQSGFQRDVRSGDLFLFLNRRRDRLKLMYWDRDGLAIWMKKVEQHYPHCFPFTGIGEVADNRARWPTAGGGMDSSSAKIGPRRRPMPKEIAVIAPPRDQLSAGPP
jgi:transposase